MGDMIKVLFYIRKSTDWVLKLFENDNKIIAIDF